MCLPRSFGGGTASAYVSSTCLLTSDAVGLPTLGGLPFLRCKVVTPLQFTPQARHLMMSSYFFLVDNVLPCATFLEYPFYDSLPLVRFILSIFQVLGRLADIGYSSVPKGTPPLPSPVPPKTSLDQLPTPNVSVRKDTPSSSTRKTYIRYEE